MPSSDRHGSGPATPTGQQAKSLPGGGGGLASVGADHRKALGTASMQRWSGVSAVIAGVLWASQGAIWTLGPKVQDISPPYRITDPALFGLFWLSVVGAVLCSASALIGLLGRAQPQVGATRVVRAGIAAAWASLGVAALAGIAVAVAAIGIAEELGLGMLTPTLNLAALLLLIAVSLAAVATLRTDVLRGWSAAVPTLLAILTLLTVGAIAASSSSGTIGLVFAVVVVSCSGATWALLGWTLSSWARS